MSNSISNSAKRKLEILKRVVDFDGCLVNRKWCFALTTEPAVKYLIKNDLVKLVRKYSNNRCGYSFLVITEKGRSYLARIGRQ